MCPSRLQGLVTAHNTSSISVKIKPLYKSNHIMGLCLIMAYLVQFLTEAFMALVSLILFFASAEYLCNSALEGTLEDISSNLFCPSKPCSRANWVSLLQQVLGISVPQHHWFMCP